VEDFDMSDDHCQDNCHIESTDGRFRKVLWVALILNAIMFVVEMSSGLHAGSVSLLADAVDFLGDAINYGISLFVLGMATIWRSRTALLKGIIMGFYGFFVLGKALWQWHAGTLPQAEVMGMIGLLALVVNVFVAFLLYSFREGDANMQSVWLCSRNDAIGNVAVILAAITVYSTGQAWPDLLVAVLMATLGLLAARKVTKAALAEIKA
jgi:Co/Zn/Cd efflux system component